MTLGKNEVSYTENSVGFRQKSTWISTSVQLSWSSFLCIRVTISKCPLRPVTMVKWSGSLLCQRNLELQVVLGRQETITSCSLKIYVTTGLVPTSVFLFGKSLGQRSLAGYSPWGLRKLGTTQKLHGNSINNYLNSQSQCIHVKGRNYTKENNFT